MKFIDPAGLAIAFVVCLAIFAPLESWIPHQTGRKFFRRGWFTDFTHFFLGDLLKKAAVFAFALPVVMLLGVLVNHELQARILRQPWWLQLIEAQVIADVGGYWGHRLAHTIPLFWRFHALHHSSEQLDWLAVARVHPIDQGFTRIFAFVPLYLLGFSKATFGFLLVLETFHAIFIHANVRVRFGWMEKVISTPAFHHWHHTNDGPEVINKNYAGLFPWVDRLFRTHHLSKDRMPAKYGIDEPTPPGYLEQIAAPFQRKGGESTVEGQSLGKPTANHRLTQIPAD